MAELKFDDFAADENSKPSGYERQSREHGSFNEFTQKALEAMALVEKLTRREYEVLARLVQGDSNKHIARHLNISPRTVEIHRAGLFFRLGARSAADAIRIAIYAGLDRTVESDVQVPVIAQARNPATQKGKG